MKIVLSAFGIMESKPIDVPENTTPSYDMVLTQPLQAFSDYHGNEVSQRPSFHKKCHFEWTGKMLGDARYYVLTDL